MVVVGYPVGFGTDERALALICLDLSTTDLPRPFYHFTSQRWSLIILRRQPTEVAPSPRAFDGFIFLQVDLFICCLFFMSALP